MASEIRANSITSRAGLSTVTMTDSGPMFSGITTFVDNSGFTFGVGGGTSIFTPATNILTLGTNNTEKVRIDANGNTNITGVTTAANFKTGVSNLHDVGLTLSGGQIDVGSNIKIGTAGVVTATSFVGSGANLTGLPAATTINNNATTKFITGTNNANELDCEANLSYNNSLVTFASSSLMVSKSTSPTISVKETAGNKEGAFRANTDGVLIRSLGNYPLIFHTNQTERAQIDGSGRFLIGTNSVYNANSYSNNLIIYENGDAGASIIGNASNSNYASLYLTDTSTAIKGYLEAQLGVNGNFTIGANGTGPIRFTNNGAERFRITTTDATLSGATDGVLNITTTDSRGSFIRFQESGTSKVWVGCGQGLSLGAATDLGLRATNDIRMRSGSEMHAVLTAEGYFAAKGMAGSWVSSNTDPASSQFHQFTQTGTGKRIVVFRQEHHAGLGVHIEMSNTGNQEALYMTGNGTTRFRVMASGNVANTNNSYGSISDIKLKENIVDANSQWNDIKAVKVRNFNFKDTPDTKMLGVVAQEIETVSPSLVSEVVDKDPDTNEALETTTKQVKYSILYMKAIKALQEAMTRIETLEQDNIALRARVTNLEGN